MSPMPGGNRLLGDAKGYLQYLFFRSSCWLVGLLPVRVSHGLGILFGEVAYRLSPRKRRTVRENMRRVVPGAGPRELSRLTRRCFHEYARYWVDFFRCYTITFQEIYDMVVPHGVEWFDRCLEKGRGAVLALPHYGSWDLIGGWVGLQYPSFWAVAEELRPRAMFEFHTELRRRMGIRIIPLGEKTVEKVIQVLMDNGMVALLSDRVVAGSGVEVEFFGERALFPVGPALLAVKLGTAVIPCHIIRKEGVYHGYVGPPLEVEVTGDTRRDVQVNTQRLARIFEGFIREDPAQWHMFQPIFGKAPLEGGEAD